MRHVQSDIIIFLVGRDFKTYIKGICLPLIIETKYLRFTTACFYNINLNIRFQSVYLGLLLLIKLILFDDSIKLLQLLV